MTSTPSFTFFCSYLLVVPLLVGFLLQDIGVQAEPSLIPTLPGACGLRSLCDEVLTLPGGCAQSLVGVLTLWSLGTLPWLVPVVLAPSEMRLSLIHI